MLRAIVAGNVGGNAQLKTVNQTVVCEFSVASSRKDKNGIDQTTWVRCSLWGKRGQALAQYLLKGTKVTVVGDLTAGAYVGNDGQARASLDMHVDDVALQGQPQGYAPQQAPQAPQYAPQQVPAQYQPQQAPQAPQTAAYAPQQAPQQYQQAPQTAGPYDDEIPF